MSLMSIDIRETSVRKQYIGTAVIRFNRVMVVAKDACWGFCGPEELDYLAQDFLLYGFIVIRVDAKTMTTLRGCITNGSVRQIIDIRDFRRALGEHAHLYIEIHPRSPIITILRSKNAAVNFGRATHAIIDPVDWYYGYDTLWFNNAEDAMTAYLTMEHTGHRIMEL